jgi:hypothetical protein
MKNKATMARLEKLVERHNELRRDMNKAELEIQAHLDMHLKGANGKKLVKVINLGLKLRGHA